MNVDDPDKPKAPKVKKTVTIEYPPVKTKPMPEKRPSYNHLKQRDASPETERPKLTKEEFEAKKKEAVLKINAMKKEKRLREEAKAKKDEVLKAKFEEESKLEREKMLEFQEQQMEIK